MGILDETDSVSNPSFAPSQSAPLIIGPGGQLTWLGPELPEPSYWQSLLKKVPSRGDGVRGHPWA